MKMMKKRVVETKDFCYTVCTFEGDPRVSPFCKSIVYRFISKGYLPVMFQLFHGRDTLLRATGVFSAMAYALLWAGRCKIAVSRQKGRFMAKASHSSELPKRSRYYQGMIDLNLIERGAHFRELKRSFVIFICLEDLFDGNLPIYTFENTCVENNVIKLNDGAIKVFVNASCTDINISPQIREFIDYLKTARSTGELTERIADDVLKIASSDKWRTEYMTNQLFYIEAREEGLAEGRAEGRSQMIITMLQTGKTPEDIHAFCSIPLDEILKVKEKLDSEL